ncbi:electron transport complex subunit RsxE [Butyricicoccus sp.]|uniref:electron transport complex subunit RsxE n=1 Tax=Butyricicoccus sp. TaxID=2049021 RepID=UPI002A8D3D00|nr:electron transport complex subunit E [Butyricicoccus sp.]
MSFGKNLKEGLFTDNPVLVQLIGLCPTLATTTSITNGIGMGLSATAVLICSNIVISLLRKIIPNKVRIAAYITVIAGFVTMVDLLLQAFIPSLSASLGTFIPLIVVNCIILGRAEAFASKNSVGKSALDGICMGLGFTFALICMSVVRELLGAGTIGGGAITVFSQPATIMILPAGAFLTLGCIIAIMQKLLKKGE